MAITAVEHAEFAPRNPLSGCVIDDRYIVTMAYNSSTSGGTGFTDYAVFDAVTQTSVGYSFPVRNVNAFSMVAYNGYAWAVGKDYNTNACNLARVNPSTGGYTIFAIGSGMRGNRATIAYANGYFFVGMLNTYNAPYDSWTFNRINATTLSSASMSGAGIAGNRFAPYATGYGNTVWVIVSAAGPVYRYKVVADTGVATDVSGTSSYPGPGTSNGATLYAGSTVWDMTTETVVRSISSGASSATNSAYGPDDLLYTVGGDTVVAVDPVNGATRTETLPVSRAERTLVFRANGKLWTPSGYPL